MSYSVPAFPGRTGPTQMARRALIAAFSLAVAFGLSGCSSESTERKTFMTFLQTRIIDKPGIRVPRLTPSEEKSFGDYAKHFAVIRNYNDSMDKTVATPMRDMVSKGMPQTLPDLMTRRADIATLRNAASELTQGVTRELAKTEAERAALVQPEDLKVVYDKAYTRTVTEPSKLFQVMMPEVEASFASAEKLADFLDKNKSKIKLHGSMVEVSDPKLHAEVNAMMQEMQGHSSKLRDAGSKMQALMYGR